MTTDLKPCWKCGGDATTRPSSFYKNISDSNNWVIDGPLVTETCLQCNTCDEAASTAELWNKFYENIHGIEKRVQKSKHLIDQLDEGLYALEKRVDILEKKLSGFLDSFTPKGLPGIIREVEEANLHKEEPKSERTFKILYADEDVAFCKIKDPSKMKAPIYECMVFNYIVMELFNEKYIKSRCKDLLDCPIEEFQEALKEFKEGKV